MAYEYSVKYKIRHPKEWNDNGIAGRDWYEGFMKRHPQLSLRTPEQISIARAKAFNRENVDSFFANLSAVYESHHYRPDRVWNMDESGFPTVPTKVQKLLAEKGSKRVGQMSTQERGTNITVAVAVNAAGQKIPPFFLFKSINHQSRFMYLASKDSVSASNSSGWMQQKEFLLFMKHFIDRSHARKDSPTLLLLDNHTSHLSVQAIDLAIEHGITMLSFPPHCTHKMQPLDRGVFKVVKALYMEKHAAWMKMNAGTEFELHHAPPLIEKSLDEGATPHNIKKAFETTGVYELNPHVFKNEDFIAAEMIERANSTADQFENGEISNEDRRAIIFDEEIPTEYFEEVSFEEVPIEEVSFNQASTSASGSVPSTSGSVVSLIASVGPVQFGIPRKKSNRGPKPMKSAILTASQTRDVLKEKSDKREVNKRKKEAKTATPVKKGKGRAKGIKTAPLKKRKPTKRAKKCVSSSDTESEEFSDLCKICNTSLPKRMNNNNTIKCRTCKQPFHLGCIQATSWFICTECDSDLDVSDDEEE